MPRTRALTVALIGATLTTCAAAASASALSFQTAAGFPRAAPSATGLALGDVDADGRRDVVVAAYSGPVSVMRGTAAGGFGPLQEIADMRVRTLVARVADVTGDGRGDVLLAGTGLHLLRSQADGTFAAPEALPVPGGSDLEVLDVDADGDLDVVGGRPGEISVGRNDGTGTFAVTTRAVEGVDGYPLAAGDLTGDGLPEVVMAAGDDLRRVNNTGDGPILQGGLIDPVPSSDEVIQRLAMGELDGVAGTDIVAADTSGVLTTLSGTPTGFGTRKTALVGSGGSDQPELALGDADLDGDLDVVDPSWSNETLVIAVNDGTGGLTNGVRRTGRGWEATALTDVDGDGAADLLAADFNGEQVLFERGTTSVLAAPPASAAVPEGGTTSITFERTGSVLAARSFDLAIEAGTADAGDIGALPRLTFAAGERTTLVTVAAVVDAVEGPQQLVLRPTAPDAGLRLAPGLGATTLTIEDAVPPATPPAPPPVVTSSVKTVVPPLRKRTLGTLRRTARQVRRSGLPVTFTCAGACQAATTVRFGGKTYGLRAVSRSSAGTTRRDLRLSIKARTALRDALRRRRTVTLVLTTVADGTQVRRSIVVRR